MLDEVVDLQPVLESILATQDYELLARTAHKTAGSVVSVGAKGLHALLKQIEDMARQPEQQVRLPILVSLLPARLEETRSHLGLTIGEL
jgi:HPt (histidine-containing phosphotransfer) domain-containing protein